MTRTVVQRFAIMVTTERWPTNEVDDDGWIPWGLTVAGEIEDLFRGRNLSGWHITHAEIIP